MTARVRRALDAAVCVLAAACFALSPYLGLAIAWARRRARAVPPTGAALVWAVPFLVVAAVQLFSGRPGSALELTLVASAGPLALRATALPRRRLVFGLAVALAVAVGAAGVQTLRASRAWSPSLGEARAVRVADGVRLEAEGEPTTFSRAWWAPAGGELTFDVRANSDGFGRGWGVSAPGFTLSRVTEGGEPFVRIDWRGGRYHSVYRRYRSEAPLGGQRVRFSVDLRTARPLEASGCRGLQLEAGSARTCRPLATESAWGSYQFEWVVPNEVESRRLTARIIDFTDTVVEVRGGRLEVRDGDRWRLLEIAAPLGVGVSLDGAEAVRVLPDDEPRRVSLPVPADGGSRREVAIQVEDAQRVELAELAFRPERGVVLPWPRPIRLRLWFDHPNLLGHALAVAGLALLAGLRPRSRRLVPAAALALVAVAATGSRAASGAFAVGALTLVGLRLSARGRIALVAGAALATLALFAVPPEVLGRLDPRTLLPDRDVNPVTRPLVWRVALERIAAAPWTGTPDGFAEAFRAEVGGPAYLQASHAHNAWLDFGVRFGLPGALAALVAAGFLVRLAWLRGRARGLAVALPVLAMNVVDTTLFTLPVLATLFAGLWTVVPRHGEPPPAGDNASRSASSAPVPPLRRNTHEEPNRDTDTTA